MKNTLKILAIILAILAVILLCYLSFRAGWNAREDSDEYESFAVKTFYSYEDAVRVCGIAGLKNQYTVDYKGDDFDVFYQFVKYHCTTKYPIDYDAFVEKISEKGLKGLSTYIFFDESFCSGHADSGHPYMSDLTIYKGDEDYDKLMENTVRPWLVLNSGVNAIEIEDKSLLSYTTYVNGDGRLFGGTIYYDGTEIIVFFSCFEPDEALMETIFDCLVNVPNE